MRASSTGGGSIWERARLSRTVRSAHRLEDQLRIAMQSVHSCFSCIRACDVVAARLRATALCLHAAHNQLCLGPRDVHLNAQSTTMLPEKSTNQRAFMKRNQLSISPIRLTLPDSTFTWLMLVQELPDFTSKSFDFFLQRRRL